MKDNVSSFTHFRGNVRRYRTRYGFSKAIRALLHYSFRAIKNKKISSSDEIILVNGYKLSLVPNDPGISSELLTFKTHEPITTKLLTKILKNGMTCLDIGSNIGYYALLESKLVGKQGKIISIEPSPQNYEYLKKNISLQDFPNIESYNFAASNKDGQVNFLLYKTSNECCTIPDGEESKYPGKIIKVPSKKIDSFVEEINLDKIDFLRMDVEGYEYYIFEGMIETLKKSRPLIQIEVHSSLIGSENLKKFFKLLRDLDYEVKSYLPRELDVPFIGTFADIKKYDIKKIENMYKSDGYVPSYIMLILANKKNPEHLTSDVLTSN